MQGFAKHLSHFSNQFNKYSTNNFYYIYYMTLKLMLCDAIWSENAKILPYTHTVDSKIHANRCKQKKKKKLIQVMVTVCRYILITAV